MVFSYFSVPNVIFLVVIIEMIEMLQMKLCFLFNNSCCSENNPYMLPITTKVRKDKANKLSRGLLIKDEWLWRNEKFGQFSETYSPPFS